MGFLTRRSIPPRLVVADLSALQAIKGVYRIPSGVALVIPWALFKELNARFRTKTEARARGYFGKLFDLLQANPGQVLLGRNMGELDHAEHNPGVKLDARHFINVEIGAALTQISGSREEFMDRAAEFAHAVDGDLDRRLEEDFARSRDAWRRIGSEMLDEKRANLFRSDVRYRLEWIQDPARVLETAVSNPKFGSGAFAWSLSTFPDKYSWPRWKRLIDWYGLQGFLYPDRSEEEFRNDFEDAQYAHLASHIGELATRDKGLNQAVGAVFRGVAVNSDLPGVEAERGGKP